MVAEHLAQDEHGALARREVLERGDEGELDTLALLVAHIGRGLAPREATVKEINDVEGVPHAELEVVTVNQAGEPVVTCYATARLDP